MVPSNWKFHPLLIPLFLTFPDSRKSRRLSLSKKAFGPLEIMRLEVTEVLPAPPSFVFLCLFEISVNFDLTFRMVS